MYSFKININNNFPCRPARLLWTLPPPVLLIVIRRSLLLKFLLAIIKRSLVVSLINYTLSYQFFFSFFSMKTAKRSYLCPFHNLKKKIILSKLNMFSLYNQVITQYFLCLKTHGFCNFKKNQFNSIIHRIDLSVLFNGTFIINVYKNSVYYSVNKHA